MIFALVQYQTLLEAMEAEDDINRKLLVENLCLAIGIVTANEYTKGIFHKFMKEIGNGNFKAADKHLARCHILSSTFKAVSSWKTIKVVS